MSVRWPSGQRIEQLSEDGWSDVKKAMDAAGHGWPTLRRAVGRLGIESDPSGARVVSASMPEEWALPNVFHFNELMRHAGVTHQ
jgi:hypothetical protein